MRFNFEIFQGKNYTKYWLLFWSFIFIGFLIFVNKGYFKQYLINQDSILVDSKDKQVKIIKSNGSVEMSFNEISTVELRQKNRFSVIKIVTENSNVEVFKNNKLILNGQKNYSTKKLFFNNSNLKIKSSNGTVKVLFKSINLKAIAVVGVISLLWILILIFSYMKNQASLTIGIFMVYLLTMYAERITFNQKILLSSMFSTFLILVSILFILIYLNNYAKKINREIYFSIFTGFIFVVIAIVPISLISYYISFDTGFGAEAVHAILQTNSSKSIEFLIDFISIKAILFFIFTSLVLFYISFWHRNSDVKDIKKSITGVLISTSLVLSFVYAKKTELPSFFTKAYEQYMSELNQFNELKNKRQINPIKASKNENGETYIIVIGESQNKNHMQIYGYPRNTTPKLQELLNNNEIIKFDNIYSNHTHTMPVLSLALTEASQYNNKSYFESASIVEIFNAANFETVWLTNQNLLGAWDNLVSIIANQADTTIGINKRIGKTTKTQKYDGDLINYLKKELDKKTSKNRVIFVHLMGNHGSYCARFPKTFEVFKGDLELEVFGKSISENKKLKKSVNCYDNSILYNDTVVSNMINDLKNYSGVNALIYMADHADDVIGQLGHNSGKFTFEMTQIPMFAYFSEEYKSKHKDIYKTFVQNQNRLFSNDMFYDTLIGLANITTNAYNPKYDLTSKDFELKDEEAKTLHGKRKYNDPENKFYWQKKNLNYLKENNLDNKFFPHRVNSVGKIKDHFNLVLNQ